jgi:ABC-2 type transport system ATP-binding protein
MIDDLLALVDLSAKKSGFVEELSRGMKQRLCLARTLVHEPDLLILDEPASGLDPRARIELRELLKELRRLGKTILVSSHILSELTEMCTHVAIIERGRLLVSGKVGDILQAMQPAREIYVRVLGRSQEAQTLLQDMPGVLSAQLMPHGYRPGQVAQVISPASSGAPISGPPQDPNSPVIPPPPGALPPPPGALPPPPPPPGSTFAPSPAPPPSAPATIYIRVNGDDLLLGEILRRLMRQEIPVFGFEEAVGNLEDIFMRTTRGLVQ